MGGVLTAKEYEEQQKKEKSVVVNRPAILPKKKQEEKKPAIEFTLMHGDYGEYNRPTYETEFAGKKIQCIDGIVKTTDRDVKDLLIENGYAYIGEKEIMEC